MCGLVLLELSINGAEACVFLSFRKQHNCLFLLSLPFEGSLIVHV